MKLLEQQTKQAFANSLSSISMEEMVRIFDHRRVQDTMEWLATILPKDELILEGGCGIGQFVLWLKERGFRMVGIDYNADLIKIGKAYDKHLDLILGDVTQIPFGNETFGAYISFGVIEHFQEGPEGAIHEAYRVLKPGGNFIVFVPQMTLAMRLTWPLRLLSRNNFVRKLFGKGPSTHYWEQYFRRKKLAKILEGQKFKVKEIYPMDYDHSVLTAFPCFRDRTMVDGITPMGENVADWCAKWMRWSMNAQLCLVCVKEDK